MTELWALRDSNPRPRHCWESFEVASDQSRASANRPDRNFQFRWRHPNEKGLTTLFLEWNVRRLVCELVD